MRHSSPRFGLHMKDEVGMESKKFLNENENMPTKSDKNDANRKEKFRE
jgi:hypothetical protein